VLHLACKVAYAAMLAAAGMVGGLPL